MSGNLSASILARLLSQDTAKLRQWQAFLNKNRIAADSLGDTIALLHAVSKKQRNRLLLEWLNAPRKRGITAVASLLHQEIVQASPANLQSVILRYAKSSTRSEMFSGYAGSPGTVLFSSP